jgi:hypothetical protein
MNEERGKKERKPDKNGIFVKGGKCSSHKRLIGKYSSDAIVGLFSKTVQENLEGIGYCRPNKIYNCDVCTFVDPSDTVQEKRKLPPKNPQYWLDKRANRKTGYPIATIAYYGADDKFASKVVVGIVLSEKDNDVAFMEKWFGTTTDVRSDREITGQIVKFLEQHEVHRVVMVDRIIGCPHEEGIDYPEGETCPQCPFWANRDRWTGERIN